MTIENITDWDQRARFDLVVSLLADMHEDSYEDMRWGQEHLGLSPGDMIDIFVEDAKKLFLLRDPDGKPLYLGAFCSTGYLSTLSRSDRDAYRLYLTKETIRFAKSEEGRRQLQGTFAACDVEDVRKGVFTYLWIFATGYDFCDEVVLSTGPTVHRFAFNYTPPDDDFVGADDDVHPEANPTASPASGAAYANAG